MTTSKALGIEPNLNDGMGARVNQAQRSSGRFESVFDGLSAAASYAGPVAASTMYYKGNYKGGDIVSAAVNSTAGYPGSNYGAASPVYYGGVGMSGLTKAGVGVSANANYGGVNLGVNSPGFAGDPTAEASQVLEASKVDGIKMLMLQQEVGMQGTRITSLSNTIAAKENMNSAVIRNVRAGG